MRFLNASVLERKSLNRNLSWGFPLGNLLPQTSVLKHRVLERKRRLNANASVLGTQRFRTLRLVCAGGYRAVGNYYLKYSWECFMRKNMHNIFLYCGQPEYFR